MSDRTATPRFLPILLLLSAVASPHALAQPTGKLLSGPPDCRTVLAPTIKDIYEIARGWGSAERETSGNGLPMISGRIDGIKYALVLYDCDEATDTCKSAQFTAGFSGANMDMQRINHWNAERRFGKAWLDDDNDPALELNFTLVGGMTRENLDDTFDWWRVVARSYRDYIYETE